MILGSAMPGVGQKLASTLAGAQKNRMKVKMNSLSILTFVLFIQNRKTLKTLENGVKGV